MAKQGPSWGEGGESPPLRGGGTHGPFPTLVNVGGGWGELGAISLPVPRSRAGSFRATGPRGACLGMAPSIALVGMPGGLILPFGGS